MDIYWEIERLRALQEDTPHIQEQQSGFLRTVVRPNNYHWMSELNNIMIAQQNEMRRCMICDGNHPRDQCIYLSEWQDYWNHAMYEEPSHFIESHFHLIHHLPLIFIKNHNHQRKNNWLTYSNIGLRNKKKSWMQYFRVKQSPYKE